MALIVNGFVRDVLQQLPMEFMAETQKLIGISLEGLRRLMQCSNRHETENGDVLGMPSQLSGCLSLAPAAAGQRHGAGFHADAMDGRQYRGPDLRGAKHRAGVHTGLLVEEK